MQNKYSRSKLVDYIVRSLDEGVSLKKLSDQVAAYLISVGRADDLSSVMRDAQEQRAIQAGTVEITVKSAHQLDPAHLKEVEAVAKSQYPSARKVISHPVQDDSVIGGVNIVLPQASLDVTVRGKLNQLRENISQV